MRTIKVWSSAVGDSINLEVHDDASEEDIRRAVNAAIAKALEEASSK